MLVRECFRFPIRKRKRDNPALKNLSAGDPLIVFAALSFPAAACRIRARTLEMTISFPIVFSCVRTCIHSRGISHLNGRSVSSGTDCFSGSSHGAGASNRTGRCIPRRIKACSARPPRSVRRRRAESARRKNSAAAVTERANFTIAPPFPSARKRTGTAASSYAQHGTFVIAHYPLHTIPAFFIK